MIKGTLLHELLSLPDYWKEVKASPRLPYPLKKIAFGKHSRQYCLMAEPANPPVAWVIYWHGGGWQFGSPEQFQKTALPWLDAGYGVVLPSYRRLPLYDYRTIRQDTIEVLTTCRDYWEKKGDNPHPPVILLGMSAGGHLAAITGLDTDIWQQADWQAQQIRGVVACGAVLDFSLMKNNPIIRLLAGSSRGELYAMANPSTQLPEQQGVLPPFLLIHGTRDGLVPYQAATDFQKRYRAHPSTTTCDLITLPEGTHLDAARWMFHDTPLRQTIMAKAEEWMRG
jgi:acetyl esterase/lipase